ncbi:PIPK domain-containing protein [Meloidogyne graminicola]|uniref:PIPK domain-containing protein n=1 Tax=Meloidogyne graminicola TaxID=189291 RepID=A0A8S9ZP56_9BILA|nr:PIPK domain-containing protein [Meloidogyne graminicola]
MTKEEKAIQLCKHLEEELFNKNKETIKINLKIKIQFELKKYLCNLFNNEKKLNKKIRNNYNISIFYSKQFEFLWKNKFNITISELIISLTKNELKGFDNPAKSKSLFFKSWDGKFFLKSIKMEELEFFLTKEDEEYKNNNLENNYKGGIINYFEYFKNKKENEKSLLPQFFAFFKFKENMHNNYYFFIQNGLFPNNCSIDFVFDLKGASFNRWKEEEEENKLNNSNEETKVLKELDFIRFKNLIEENNKPEGKFPKGILLNSKDYKEITEIIKNDSNFLAKHNIVDYSLLLGIMKDNKQLNKYKTSFQLNSYKAECINCYNNTINIKQNIIIFIGIIDVLQLFNFTKLSEYIFKKLFIYPKYKSFPLLLNKKQYDQCSIIPTNQYNERFNDYINTIIFKNEEN